MTFRTLGRIVGVADNLAYVVLYSWGLGAAIGIPIDDLERAGIIASVGARFYVHARVPGDQPRYEDFDLTKLTPVESPRSG